MAQMAQNPYRISTMEPPTPFKLHAAQQNNVIQQKYRQAAIDRYSYRQHSVNKTVAPEDARLKYLFDEPYKYSEYRDPQPKRTYGWAAGMHDGYGYNHGASRYGSNSNIRGDVNATGATMDSIGYGDHRNNNYNRVYGISTNERIEAHLNGDVIYQQPNRPARPMSASASRSADRYRTQLMGPGSELPLAVRPQSARVQSPKQVRWVEQAAGDRYIGEMGPVPQSAQETYGYPSEQPPHNNRIYATEEQYTTF